MRRSGFSRWAIVLAGLTVALPLVVPGPAAADTDGTVWGAYVNPRSGESEQTAVQRLEGTVGRQLGVVRDFLLWNETFPAPYHTWLHDTGRTLILSVTANRTNGTTVRWADIAAAQPGSTLYNDIVRWADRVQVWRVPVYFAFNHEPESAANRTKGTAAEFIGAWRNIHTVFRDRGVTNAKFLWIMTDYSFTVSPQDRRFASKWYPGDEYVDAMGADAYNWYTCRPGINTPWRTLEQIITPFRDFGAQHPGKELWLTEWASAEDPNQPGRKAQWIAEAQELFKRPDYAQFRGLSWFDREHGGGTSCVWYADSSDSSLTAFTAMGNDPFYGRTITPEPAPDPDGSIGFVVSSATSPTSGDAAIVTHLQNAGWTVHLIDDNAFVRTDISSRELLLVSSTTDTGLMSGRLTYLDKPVVTWKPWLYDDMRMVIPGARGTLSASTVTVAAGAPLSAGLSGSVRVTTTQQTLPWGTPAAGADVAATVGTRATAFSYDAGDTLADGTAAPNCRAAVTNYHNVPLVFTANGWTLFDAAVAWAAAC